MTFSQRKDSLNQCKLWLLWREIKSLSHLPPDGEYSSKVNWKYFNPDMTLQLRQKQQLFAVTGAESPFEWTDLGRKGLPNFLKVLRESISPKASNNQAPVKKKKSLIFCCELYPSFLLSPKAAPICQERKMGFTTATRSSLGASMLIETWNLEKASWVGLVLSLHSGSNTESQWVNGRYGTLRRHPQGNQGISLLARECIITEP